MTTRQLQHFLAIVQYGSINRAAARLAISQQSLLASANALEKSLGFSLFQRSHSGATLTTKGEAVLTDAKKIMDIVRRWEKLRDAEETGQITIPVAGTISMVNFILDPVSRDFKAGHPNVSLEIHEIKRLELISMVLHEFMIGVFGAIPPSDIDVTRAAVEKMDMEFEVLCRDDYALIVNADNPVTGGNAITTELLSHFTPAMYPKDTESFCYKGVYDFFSKNSAPFLASKQETLLGLVAENPTVACVFPRSAARSRYVQKGSVRAVDILDFPMPGHNCMVCPRRERLSSIEQELIEAIHSQSIASFGKQD